MSIFLYTGLPGNGKSLNLMKMVYSLGYRNRRLYRKTGVLRQIFSNIKFSKQVEEEFSGMFRYYTDPFLLPDIAYGCDIIFDEIATYLDSQQFALCPSSFKRFLQQHRKKGAIDIYGTTQDFAMIDVSLRRLCTEVEVCIKVFGSGDLSPTRTEVKNPWGLIISRKVERSSFKDGMDNFKYKEIIGSWTWITKKLCEGYDTQQTLNVAEYPPLRHVARHCNTCGTTKIVHT